MANPSAYVCYYPNQLCSLYSSLQPGSHRLITIPPFSSHCFLLYHYKAHVGNDYLSAYLSSLPHFELLEDMEFGLIYVSQCLLHLAWPRGREEGSKGEREGQ